MSHAHTAPNLPRDGPFARTGRLPVAQKSKPAPIRPTQNRSTQLAGTTLDISEKKGESAMRPPFHEKWKDEIKRYFDEHGLDHSKLPEMGGSYGKTVTIFQYFDREKKIDWETFRDDIPAPAVFIVREEDGRPAFEETEITRKYLSRDPE